MKSKKILLISFIFTLLITIIPIPHKTVVGTECNDPKNNPPYFCYEYLPSHGFPLPFATVDPFESPVSSIKWSQLHIIAFLIVFPINWLIFWIIFKLISLTYKKIFKADTA